MKKGLQVFGEENDMKKRIKVEKQPASKNKEIYGLFIPSSEVKSENNLIL